MDEVVQFINRFTNNGKRTEVIECFTNGCCYWFAYILKARFTPCLPTHKPYGIVHDPIVGHFAYSVYGRVYDITGDITDQDHKWDWWEGFAIAEPKVARHIYESCALFIKEDNDNE